MDEERLETISRQLKTLTALVVELHAELRRRDAGHPRGEIDRAVRERGPDPLYAME